MRAVEIAPVSLKELGTYGNSPHRWLDTYGNDSWPESDQPSLFWEQLRDFSVSVAQEEFKWGKLPRISKYQILDKLILDKFPDNVEHRRLIELQEKVEESLPEGRKIGNLPGLCEVGHALINFTTDITCINEHTQKITAIDFLPIKLNELPWYSYTILDIKYRLLESYIPELTYLIYSVAPGNQLKIRRFLPKESIQKLYISLQFWHSGIVNKIVSQK